MPQSTPETLTVAGIACRFPGASNRHEFWANLLSKTVSISAVPTDRWDAEEFVSAERADGKTVTCMAGWLPHIDRFDFAYFKMSKKEGLLAPSPLRGTELRAARSYRRRTATGATYRTCRSTDCRILSSDPFSVISGMRDEMRHPPYPCPVPLSRPSRLCPDCKSTQPKAGEKG